jgi:hypothetical protein
MPNIKAKMINSGEHHVIEISTGKVIGKMQEVGGVWWINNIRYSRNFLKSLADFEDEVYNTPEPVPDWQLFLVGATLLCALLVLIGVIIGVYA